ncbi:MULTISPECIES: hypothetical protein [unclassified Spiroplasma]|uniref:hypothetical protein n=1 Tax=unclassified Spiroplasma TaxID=2637901 RepID=UPI00313AC255
MSFKLIKKPTLKVWWNTKREITLRLLIIINVVLFLCLSYFIGFGWGQNLQIDKFIIGLIADRKFFKNSYYLGLSSCGLTAVLTLITLIVMLKVKEENFLKIWVIIIAVLWIIYFLIVFTISLLNNCWPQWLLTSFIIFNLNFLILEVSTICLFKEIKYQKILKLSFEYKNDNKIGVK